ncbi:hypothetical protein BKA67DRAFT_586443 [Truncatella angustata]|uniref:Uncharacterized protein n=1 Tax=Truncatella angustata TaxID=152316 RepID=A0A9P8RIE2_9PEZI|nr:uncharacterized protein BKA67DRAFT_586443 [Truncatella angustata]KAH6644908.1 hypothetical protein BKA67DRAFT_586443 [Truncatella angustata]
MAADSSPRSVADATRFTSNTPHANSKARKVVGGTQSTATTTTSTTTAPSSSSLPKAQPRTASASASAPQPPRRPAPASASASASAAALAGAHGQGHGHKPESLDERVRRLRAAHLAARNHEVSRMDKVISNSRRYMDAAHRYTVMGLIGFSGMSPHPPGRRCTLTPPSSFQGSLSSSQYMLP